jgi:hypothetical protein
MRRRRKRFALSTYPLRWTRTNGIYQVREGFIVDEDEEENEEGVVKHKKRKRRRERDEEEELDVEDLELIGETYPEDQNRVAKPVGSLVLGIPISD